MEPVNYSYSMPLYKPATDWCLFPALSLVLGSTLACVYAAQLPCVPRAAAPEATLPAAVAMAVPRPVDHSPRPRLAKAPRRLTCPASWLRPLRQALLAERRSGPVKGILAIGDTPTGTHIPNIIYDDGHHLLAMGSLTGPLVLGDSLAAYPDAMLTANAVHRHPANLGLAL